MMSWWVDFIINTSQLIYSSRLHVAFSLAGAHWQRGIKV